MRGLLLDDLLAALGVFGVELGGVGTHFLEAGFVLQGVAVAGGEIALAFFVAALFADEVETHGASAEAELVDDSFFQIAAVAGVETLDAVAEKTDAQRARAGLHGVEYFKALG